MLLLTEVGRLRLPRALRRWLQPPSRSSHGPGEVPETRAWLHGSNTLTAQERASLHVDPVVTDALIDDLLPAVKHIAISGSMAVDNVVRRAREPEVRQQADTARAVRALLEEPARLGHAYFVRRWVERGMPRRDAERRFVHLLSDLKDLEAELRLRGGSAGPASVNKGDTPVDQLVLNAAVNWRRHTGQHPDTSEPSAFVKFCLALASLAGLPLSRDRLRRVLHRGQ